MLIHLYRGVVEHHITVIRQTSQHV